MVSHKARCLSVVDCWDPQFCLKIYDLWKFPHLGGWVDVCMGRWMGGVSYLYNCQFLGGLSLHLNHLTASHMTNYDWPFGTLPFGLFWSNLDTRDLETYSRTYSGNFWNMSIFDNSRAVWGLFRKWVVSENHILLGNGWPTPGYSDLTLGGEVPRLNHMPICFPIQNT